MLHHYPSDDAIRRGWFALRCLITSLQVRFYLEFVGLRFENLRRMEAEARRLLSIDNPLHQDQRRAHNCTVRLESLVASTPFLLKNGEKYAHRDTLNHMLRFELDDKMNALSSMKLRCDNHRSNLKWRYSL